jgi:hypothetical protein
MVLLLFLLIGSIQVFHQVIYNIYYFHPCKSQFNFYVYIFIVCTENNPAAAIIMQGLGQIILVLIITAIFYGPKM